MRLRRCATTIVLTAGMSVPFVGSALAADLNCADFGSQAEAQAVLVADPSDPNNLDANDNGQACEEFGYTGTGSGGEVSTTPSGGVAAGDGSTATDDNTVPYIFGGLALMGAAGAAIASRRTARGSA